ncbi:MULTISPECIES: MFS transporter [Paenibacillus]|uniref:MFS transporter n=1 Tax=Paenibacillus TaxID=44249 RepID=UPI00042EBF9D|nr:MULTISPECIES: MFS transporter [Paenibacillus]AHM68459.1 major facilitator superfamily protein [Paenibacillus polymyxa SQR-21]AIY09177.1 MFS transporter [Paenibacillus polymyxa]KAF6621337.1 MFS transporter [Paenibacillus sp. EKM101P]KAF6622641.1 MFS transporter [Paenibacillus sp. EKM102P]KAF6632491.1 MFS transporter [Paenibacillus sp. EKM10P]
MKEKKELQSTPSIWRNGHFRRMFAAHTAASFGDWFDAIAIQVLVAYRWEADPMLIALIPVVMALPGLLLGSIAGTLADRVHKARLMIGCDVAVALLTLTILAVPGPVWLLPLLGLRAAAGVFQMPSQQGLTRTVVASGDLFRATSLNGLVNQASKVAGPLLGAMTLTVLSPQACIILNALLRLCSGLLLWPLRGIGPALASTDQQAIADEQLEKSTSVTAHGADDAKVQGEPAHVSRFFSQWREGWAFLWRSRMLLHTLIFGLFGLIAILMIDYQFPTLLRVLAPGNESLLGWLVSAIGAGAVGCMLVLNRLNRISAGWGLGGGYVLIGGAIAALGWAQPGTGLPVLLTIGAMLGVGNGLYIITQNYILQAKTPADMVGRVFGIQSTVIGAIMVISPLTGGVLIRIAGAGTAFVWIGMSVGILGLAGLLLQSVIWRESLADPTPSTEQNVDLA